MKKAIKKKFTWLISSRINQHRIFIHLQIEFINSTLPQEFTAGHDNGTSPPALLVNLYQLVVNDLSHSGDEDIASNMERELLCHVLSFM